MSNLITDYLLVLAISIFAFRICWNRDLEESFLKYAWVSTFGLFAVASFIGGTYHGLLEGTGSVLSEGTWIATTIFIQLASLALVLTILKQFIRSNSLRRILVSILVLKFVLIVILLVNQPRFLFVIYGYGIDMLVSLTVLVYVAITKRTPQTQWMLGGILITLGASVVQQIPLNLWGVLDQNDIYHFILIGAFYCLYEGIMESDTSSMKDF